MSDGEGMYFWQLSRGHTPFRTGCGHARLHCARAYRIGAKLQAAAAWCIVQSEAEINRYNLHFKLLNYQWNAGACGRTQDVSHRAAIALIVHATIAQASDQHHIGLASFTGPRQLRFFFRMHIRLGLWMAMHLRMRRATPPVYLDLWEGRVEQNDCQEDWL